MEELEDTDDRLVLEDEAESPVERWMLLCDEPMDDLEIDLGYPMRTEGLKSGPATSEARVIVWREGMRGGGEEQDAICDTTSGAAWN